VTGLDRFRALLLADEALRMELARCDRADRFVEAALAIAGRYDIALAPGDLDPFVNPDPLGLNRPDGVTVASPDWPSPNYLPIRADERIGVEWAHFAGAPLAQPFYTESARRALARPLNQLIRFRTAPDDFVGNARPKESLPPDGFIFHMSRCGSTLVSQMLAALPGTILVSEAAPLDTIVQLGAPEALRAMAPLCRQAQRLARACAAALPPSLSRRALAVPVPRPGPGARLAAAPARRRARAAIRAVRTLWDREWDEPAGARLLRAGVGTDLRRGGRA